MPLGCSFSKRDFYPLVLLLFTTCSLFVACGRRPWKNVKSYNKIYPEGSVKGYSESPIGQSNPRRRNSKFLRGRTPKIVQGGVADYGEWPWQVSLRQWRTCKFFNLVNLSFFACLIYVPLKLLSKKLYISTYAISKF